MLNHRRWIWGAAVAVAAGVVYLSVQPRGLEVQVATAVRGTVESWIEARGRTTLKRTVLITMPLDGRVLPIELRAGDRVEAGQVVARLDPEPWRIRLDIASAEVERLRHAIAEHDDNRLENNALKSMDQTLASVTSLVEATRQQTQASQQQFEYAEQEYQRKSRLFENKAITESERDAAWLFRIQSQLGYHRDRLIERSGETALAALRLVRQSIADYIDRKRLHRKVLEQELRQAELRRDQAQRDWEKVTIRSPVDGVVLKRHVANERVLPSGTLLLEIGRVEDLQVEADLLSDDAVRLAVGRPVLWSFHADGRDPIDGRLSRIAPRGFTKRSSLGVEQQRVTVTIDFDTGRLPERMSLPAVAYRVYVRVLADRREGVIKVPRSALFQDSRGRWMVFLVRNGVARVRPIEVGLMNLDEAEVRGGLKAGDRVVLEPPNELRDGDVVRAAG
ncbi:MAG: efflux RND transporter periplasmic adaptor subunit [Planctomycetota bacterium]|nr:MAG: efflux RND transporter periplasmic adaptor subunit [Planctomycetota bacterium]